MKIITKRSVIFSALAAVLLAAALIISCNVPQVDELTDNEPSKPGTGKVRLTINSRNASRTILPTALTSTTRYLLKLTGNGGSLDDFYANVAAGSEQTINDIPVGNYVSAQVFVYDSGATPLSSAGGTYNFANYEDFSIGESSSENNSGSGWNVNNITSVALGSYATALYAPGTKTGDGSFRYTITKAGGGNSGRFSATASDHTYKILGRAPTSNFNSGASADVVFGTATPISSIPSGSYNVVYTFKDNSAIQNVVYFYEILHVYKNMESVFVKELSNDIFPGLPANNNNGSITITAPTVLVDVTCNLEADVGGSGATVTTTSHGWLVEIENTTSDAILVFKVTIPGSGVTFGTWTLLPDIDPINDGTDGVAYVDAYTPYQTRTITINTTKSNFTSATEFTNISDGSFYYTQQELTYSGIQFNSPVIQIKFVDP